MNLLKVVSMALLALLACCTTKAPIGFLDNIPAQSSVIVGVDLDQMLKMAGCGSKGGTLTLTSDLTKLLARIDSNALITIEAVASQGSWLDLSQTFSLRINKHSSWIFTAPVREGHALPLNYSSSTKNKLLERVYIYTLTPHVSMVVAGNQAYFLSPDSAVKHIEQMVSLARLSSLGNNPSLQEFFSDTQQVKARLAIDLNDNPAGDPCDEIRIALNLRERTLALKANAYYKGEAVNPFSHLLTIDPEALDWMPNGCVAAAAMGVSPEVLRKAAEMYHNMDAKTRLAVNGLIAMLDPQGGTVAIGAAPGGNAETIKKLSLENWQFKALLPMGEKAEPAALLIDKFIEGIYSETVDDYLAITNYDPEYYPSEYDAWPTTAFGAKALFTATVPYKSQAMKALRFKNGYELRIVGADSVAITTLRLLGTGYYITPAIVRDALQIIK